MLDHNINHLNHSFYIIRLFSLHLYNLYYSTLLSSNLLYAMPSIVLQSLFFYYKLKILLILILFSPFNSKKPRLMPRLKIYLYKISRNTIVNYYIHIPTEAISIKLIIFCLIFIISNCLISFLYHLLYSDMDYSFCQENASLIRFSSY